MTGGYRATETIKLTMELNSIPKPLRNDHKVVRSIILTKRFGIFYQGLRSERATGDEATICKFAFVLSFVRGFTLDWRTWVDQHDQRQRTIEDWELSRS
jgi:hypothetical protein